MSANAASNVRRPISRLPRGYQRFRASINSSAIRAVNAFMRSGSIQGECQSAVGNLINEAFVIHELVRCAEGAPGNEHDFASLSAIY
jgi:hypothetical protein